jgi:hypothetical protein
MNEKSNVPSERFVQLVSNKAPGVPSERCSPPHQFLSTMCFAGKLLHFDIVLYFRKMAI